MRRCADSRPCAPISNTALPCTNDTLRKWVRQPEARDRVTTNSDHHHPVAANVLERDFTADAKNCKWAADITYVWTRCGWLYLAVVLDLYSRRVVGWAMSNRITRELALNALSMALTHRPRPEPLVHHSDSGSQYASADYRRLLDAHGIECSMSRRANCWDNAVVESFFATLKPTRSE